ncbi:MAG: T9SS type A sorting domain-containing protein [Bacteroidales bacterium]|nr:T9SS type A sorting domain-containing protein [Bacteroidales bacterium]
MKRFFCFFVAFVACIEFSGAQSAKTIGTGTDSSARYPSYTGYKYSLNEYIFTYSEMPSGYFVNISSISFYYTGKGPNKRDTNYVRRMKIFMKNVTKSEFESDTDAVALNPAADLVFEGRVTASSAGWVTIKLDRPFGYYGRPGNHLLIAVYDSTGSYSSRYFRYSKYSDYRTLQYYSDSYIPNPEIPFRYTGSNKYRKTERPNIRLEYTTSGCNASIPYTCDFSSKEERGMWALRNICSDSIRYADWHFDGNSLVCGRGNTNTYKKYNYNEVVLAERRIYLGHSDSITVSFDCTVGGHGTSSGAYDYLCVFLLPIDSNWMPLNTSSCSYLGSPKAHTAYDLPHILHFEEGLLGTKLMDRNNETMRTTIPNPAKGYNYKLVFVWRNTANTNGTGPTIKNLSVIGKFAAPEYTPKSTAQWYGYAASSAPSDIADKFITFTMQDLEHVTAATDNTVETNYASTYAGGKVWYFTVDNPRSIGNAFIDKTNRKIYGFETTELSSGTLTENVKTMSYNPADGRLYFIAGDQKLYRMDLDDKEHFTVMGQMTDTLQAFAINAQGEAYGVTYSNASNTGRFVRVNLKDGSTTLVGSTGVKSVTYVQSMAFDYRTGELFWAQCGNNYPYYMYYVDVTTGQAKTVGIIGGNIGSGIELTGLFTSDNPEAIRQIASEKLSVYPNPANSMLHIFNAKGGMLQLFDVTGRQIMSRQLPGNVEEISLDISTLANGVYFVKIGGSTAKFVKE